MILPDIINYLLSLEGFSGAPARQGGFQVIINPFPPNTTISYAIQPAAGIYGQLGWTALFGAQMVANAFTGVIQQSGGSTFSGVITQELINDGISYLALVTRAQPTQLRVTNNTPLNQYYEMSGYYLLIPAEADLNIINKALLRLQNMGTAEKLLQEANRLLSVLAKHDGTPKPGGR